MASGDRAPRYWVFLRRMAAGTEGCRNGISTAFPQNTASTYRKYFECIAAQLVPVPTPDKVYTDEQTVIHHMHRLQECRVTTQLLCQQRTLLRSKLQHFFAVDPVEVLQHRAGILFGHFFRVLSPHSTALEIVRLVDILVWREQIVHDDEVNLLASWELDTM